MTSLARQQPESAYSFTSQHISLDEFKHQTSSNQLIGHHTHHWDQCLTKGSISFCNGSYIDAQGKEHAMNLSLTVRNGSWSIDALDFSPYFP